MYPPAAAPPAHGPGDPQALVPRLSPRAIFGLRVITPAGRVRSSVPSSRPVRPRRRRAVRCLTYRAAALRWQHGQTLLLRWHGSAPAARAGCPGRWAPGVWYRPRTRPIPGIPPPGLAPRAPVRLPALRAKIATASLRPWGPGMTAGQPTSPSPRTPAAARDTVARPSTPPPETSSSLQWTSAAAGCFLWIWCAAGRHHRHHLPTGWPRPLSQGLPSPPTSRRAKRARGRDDPSGWSWKPYSAGGSVDACHGGQGRLALFWRVGSLVP